MAILIDTSAILPMLNRGDADYTLVTSVWERLVTDKEEELIIHNYVLVEALALVANRLGLGAVQALSGTVVPLLTVIWVDASLHAAAESAWLTANRRQLSLVDCASFVVMRQRGLTTALALDVHFREQGFTCLP
jgi:uncharacterized protein